MKSVNFELSGSDVEAIIVALPLLTLFESDEVQLNVCEEACNSAIQKLSNMTNVFSSIELRMICGAVTLAKEYLAGHIKLDVPAEDKAALRKHLFTYNKLEKVFAKLY